MATRVIPQQVEVTCDCCGIVTTKAFGKGRAVMQAKLTFKRSALDAQGMPCADATVDRDLCDECAIAIGDAINAVCSQRSAVANDATA